MAEPRILVAATSATFEYGGQPVWLTQDRTTVREGHPLTKGREHLFKPLEVDFELPAAKPAEPPKTAPAGQRRAAQPATQGKSAAKT